MSGRTLREEDLGRTPLGVSERQPRRAAWLAQAAAGSVLWCTLIAAAVAKPSARLDQAVATHHDPGGWVEEWVAACPRGNAPPASSSGCRLYVLVRDPIDAKDELLDTVNTDEVNGGAHGEAKKKVNLSQGLLRERFRARWEATQLRLLRLDLDEAAAGGGFVTLLRGIAPRTGLAALDVDLDGMPEPLLVQRGRAHWVSEGDGEARLVPWLEQEGAPPAGLLSSLEPHARTVAWADVGSVTLYRIESPEEPPRRLQRETLPLRARVGSTTLRLETPWVQRVEALSHAVPAGSTADVAASAAPARFAIGPLESGPGRWEILLLTASAADNADAPLERIWVRTPGAERPIDAHFFTLGDQSDDVYLLAQSLRSDKMGMLERKKVRLFRLRADRTRSGTAPLFAHLSVSRMWQGLGTLPGLTANGALQLTLLQREGFAGKKLQVDRFWAQAGAQLSAAASGQRTVVKTPFADWALVPDLTGDGEDDLLLQSQGLHLHPGRPLGKGRRAFENAAWFHALPKSSDPGVRISIAFDEDGAAESAEINEDINTDLQAEREAEAGREGARATLDDTVDWGTPRVFRGGTLSHIVLVGHRGARRRGGSHQVYALRIPGAAAHP